MAEETPIYTLIRLCRHQLLGWQLYLFLNVTSGKDSLPEDISPNQTGANHFGPSSRLFTASQKRLVFFSDLGLLAVLSFLAFMGTRIGFGTVALLYLVPYFWVHHWLVAITYLHHTHPEVPYHTTETWTFTKGALGTIDRNFGFIGRHLFHEIIDYHVVHHLFPRIPFYHAEEATRAIEPLLGKQYINAKEDSFIWSLWSTFRSCVYIAKDYSIGNGAGDKLFWVVK